MSRSVEEEGWKRAVAIAFLPECVGAINPASDKIKEQVLCRLCRERYPISVSRCSKKKDESVRSLWPSYLDVVVL